MRAGDTTKHTHDVQCAGFTYVAMLFALAIFGMTLAVVGVSWSTVSQRDKENELMEVGTAYANAIAEYYMLSPGANKAYPKKLEDLTDDKRFVGIMRHLRQVYRDPMTNSLEWGIIKTADGEGIAGIYSLSEKPTLHTRSIVINDTLTISGSRYADWKFVFIPPSS